MTFALKYKQTDYSIWFTALAAIVLSYLMVWKYNSAATPVNFIDGDATYYYYYLQSSFVDSSLIHYNWLNPGSGSYITHHPVGISLLLLPFFIPALLGANLFNYPVDGLSAPFQLGISLAAVFYAIVGLVYLKKLFSLNNIPDKIAAITIALVFFGTTLFNYTLVESAMSHVYSFCFITAFLYYSCRFVLQNNNRDLLLAALAFGIVFLIRANNILIIFSLFFWFKNKAQCVSFFKSLLKSKTFYYALLIPLACLAFELLTWAVRESNVYANRYAPYGFYWLNPKLIKMLFGFNAGFFIYAPLCFLFLFGLIAVYKENRFSFYAMAAFLGFLFYFFSTYSAYTYFDGIGIRVLIDYYAVFAMLGAKFFALLEAKKILFALATIIALFFVLVNVIYTYQNKHNILLRSGMTFDQWKYIFLKTASEYEHSLGGSHDLTPYSKHHPEAALQADVAAQLPFNFSHQEYGAGIVFNRLGFDSKRILLKISCARTEQVQNASKDVVICMMLTDKQTHQPKSYSQILLNETPATSCCDEKNYNYSFVMNADFEQNDKLAVYLRNIGGGPFLLNKFSVNVYNYNYHIK